MVVVICRSAALIALSTLVEDVTRFPPIPLLVRFSIAASTLTDEVEREFEVALMFASAVSVEFELVTKLVLVFWAVVIAAAEFVRAVSVLAEEVLRSVLEVLSAVIKFAFVVIAPSTLADDTLSCTDEVFAAVIALSTLIEETERLFEEV
jgi:hypothetical protein